MILGIYRHKEKGGLYLATHESINTTNGINDGQVLINYHPMVNIDNEKWSRDKQEFLTNFEFVQEKD